MITVCAVRTGEKYPIEYVEILFASIARHLTVEHDYCLLTDSVSEVPKVDGILGVRLTNEAGWWAKLELFRQDWRWRKPVLYFDLDVIITGSLDDLANYDGDLVAIRDWQLADMANSSVMRIMPGTAPDIWSHYAAGRDAAKFRYRWGDQHLITRVAGERLGYWPREWCASWKATAREEWPAARVICCHGTPKPHQLTDDSIVKENWHAER